MSQSSETVQTLQLVTTADGSQTILDPVTGSTYHSRHGAVTESRHVFIAQGLRKVIRDAVTEVTILEMGFGTGLNALLTALKAVEKEICINYYTVELNPIPKDIWTKYQLPDELREHKQLLDELHELSWDTGHVVSEFFQLYKHQGSILELKPGMKFDLVYYDAFEPETQPELWTEELFGTIFTWMNPKGILTTYCCKGDVRRAMIKAGFEVEKIPGPPGKREMIRATRPL